MRELWLQGALVVPACAPPSGPVGRAAQDPPESFLAACRAALAGGADDAGEARSYAGDGKLWGLPGRVRLLVQPGPRYRFEFDGELDVVWALRPEEGWELDPGGAPWPLEGADLERRLWPALVMSGDWLVDAELAPTIRVELAPDDGQGELESARLALAHGVLDVSLSVSRSTHLPVRLSIGDGGLEQTVEFSSWQGGPGRPWPMRVVIDGEATGTVMEFAGPATPSTEEELAAPAPLTDTTFTPGASPEVECRRTPSGHLLVHPTVDERDVGWFLFDSGAGRLSLDPRQSRELGLAPFGRRTMLGAGGELDVPFARASSLRLGGLVLARPLFTELDCAPISRACGAEVAGLIGSDVFRRAVVEIERATPAIRVFPPSDYTRERDWTRLSFDRQLACIEARFEGERSGLFRIDTGSSLPLVFHGPAVRELGLLQGRETRAAGSTGLGGGFRGRAGELEWIEFGGLLRERVPTLFSEAESGVLATRATLGIMGAGVLADELLVFDYPSRRMAFAPQAR